MHTSAEGQSVVVRKEEGRLLRLARWREEEHKRNGQKERIVMEGDEPLLLLLLSTVFQPLNKHSLTLEGMHCLGT